MLKLKKIIKISFITLVLFLNGIEAESFELKQGQLYRDPQLENFLLTILQPLYKAAGMNPSVVKTRVIADKNYNAYATLEDLIVVYTGFIIQTKTVEEMAGVLAHETGHQAGHHVLRRISDVVPKAATTMVLGAALGGALALATGKPEIGIAGILAAQNISASQFTAYTRTQERIADDYAVHLMLKLNWPVWGFCDSTKKMCELQKDFGSKEIPIYLQTHPASIERYDYVNQFVSKGYQGRMPERYQYGFKMAKARIAAFTLSKNEIDLLYSDLTQPDAMYAQALSVAVSGNYDESVKLLSKLIQQYPQDPYLIFARSEVYVASGHPDKALMDINKAIPVAEKNSLTGKKEILMRFEKAKIYLILKQAHEALNEMSYIEQLDKDLKSNPIFWIQYSRIYDLMENKIMLSYALAEANLWMNNLDVAEKYLKIAKDLSKPSTVAWVKIQDLELRLKQMRENSFGY